MTPPLTGDSTLNGDAKIILAVLKEKLSNIEITLTKQIEELKHDITGYITAMRKDLASLEEKVECDHVELKTMKKDVDANTKLREWLFYSMAGTAVQLVLTIGLLVAVITKFF